MIDSKKLPQSAVLKKNKKLTALAAVVTVIADAASERGSIGKESCQCNIRN